MSQYLGFDDDSLSSDSTHPPAQRESPPQYVSRRTSVVSSHRSRSTAELNADAMGLARQLAGGVQEQLQQATARELRQAEEVRRAQQEARDRELRLQQEALERERLEAAEARQLQEDARKAQEVAYSIEVERTRQADGREDRLFDQFRDCMEKTL